MENDINKMLLIDCNLPHKAQQICQDLINLNYHDFFHYMLRKSVQLSQQTTNTKQNHNQQKNMALKRTLFILNRQICKILKNIQNKQTNQISEVWKILKSILVVPSLDHKILTLLIPSISSIMSLCKINEIQYIFNSFYESKQGIVSMIILAEGLIEICVPSKIISRIGKQLFMNLAKQIFDSFTCLLKSLKEIESEKIAVKMVCSEVQKWNTFQLFLLKFLQVLSSKKGCEIDVAEIVQSKAYIKLRDIFWIAQYALRIEQNLLRQENDNLEGSKYSNFFFILECKHKKINSCINSLRATTFDIITFILSRALHPPNNLKCSYSQFVSLLTYKLYDKAIWDISLFGSKNTLYDSFERLEEAKQVIRSLFDFISNSFWISQLKQKIVRIIPEIASQRQFLFFGCICNINLFEEQYYEDLTNYSEVFTKKKYFLVVSDFMCQILPYLNFSNDLMIDFFSDIAIGMLNNQKDFNIIMLNYGLTEQIKARIQTHKVNLYFYLIKKVINHNYHGESNKGLIESKSLFELIELAENKFQSLQTIIKVQFLSFLLELTDEWSQNRFIGLVQKVVIQVNQILSQPCDLHVFLLDFSYKSIAKLSKKVLGLIEPNEDIHLIDLLFKGLIQNFNLCGPFSENYTFQILANLVKDLNWTKLGRAFDNNFGILDLCFKKLINLKKKTSPNFISKKFIKQSLNTEFLELIKNCVYCLQLQFDQKNENMQIKISQMRELIIQIFQIFVDLIEELQMVQISQICSIIDVLTGTHLQIGVSECLCLIIKTDERLVSIFMDYLSKCRQISPILLKCVQNIIISFDGKVNNDFLTQIVFKIQRSFIKVTLQTVDPAILSQTLALINKLFLYQNQNEIQFTRLNSLLRLLLRLNETQPFEKKQVKTSNRSQRLSQMRFEIHEPDFKKVKIKFLQLKFFLLSTNLDTLSIANTQKQGSYSKTKLFSDLSQEYNSFKKKMSLEELTFLIFGLGYYMKQNCGHEEMKFLLKLALDVLFMVQKKLDLTHYLKKRFNPIQALIHQILKVIDRMSNQIQYKTLQTINQILKELECAQINTPTSRKIIKIKQHRFSSFFKSYSKNQDVII